MSFVLFLSLLGQELSGVASHLAGIAGEHVSRGDVALREEAGDFRFQGAVIDDSAGQRRFSHAEMALWQRFSDPAGPIMG